MWVRGLKLSWSNYLNENYQVAPYVGAWIETSKTLQTNTEFMSHPMWVRGLKPNIEI